MVGWGSTKGSIEEAVERMRANGHKVSSLHLRFIQPMPSGIKQVMQRFKQVITVETNWSDDLDSEIIDDDNRRFTNLAWLLRARYLIDIDCWSEVKGQSMKPVTIERLILERLQ